MIRQLAVIATMLGGTHVTTTDARFLSREELKHQTCKSNSFQIISRAQIDSPPHAAVDLLTIPDASDKYRFECLQLFTHLRFPERTTPAVERTCTEARGFQTQGDSLTDGANLEWLELCTRFADNATVTAENAIALDQQAQDLGMQPGDANDNAGLLSNGGNGWYCRQLTEYSNPADPQRLVIVGKHGDPARQIKIRWKTTNVNPECYPRDLTLQVVGFQDRELRPQVAVGVIFVIAVIGICLLVLAFGWYNLKKSGKKFQKGDLVRNDTLTNVNEEDEGEDVIGSPMMDHENNMKNKMSAASGKKLDLYNEDADSDDDDADMKKTDFYGEGDGSDMEPNATQKHQPNKIPTSLDNSGAQLIATPPTKHRTAVGADGIHAHPLPPPWWQRADYNNAQINNLNPMQGGGGSPPNFPPATATQNMNNSNNQQQLYSPTNGSLRGVATIPAIGGGGGGAIVGGIVAPPYPPPPGSRTHTPFGGNNTISGPADLVTAGALVPYNNNTQSQQQQFNAGVGGGQQQPELVLTCTDCMLPVEGAPPICAETGKRHY